MRRTISWLVLLLLAACSAPPVVQPTVADTQIPQTTLTSTATEIPLVPTSTPQPRLGSVAYGPDLEGFPSNVNPLTGIEVSDPSLLKLPAVLVSISNMPFTARPQAGPGFASWVYELYIGEGATRFMNVFYGQYPRTIPSINGNCKVIMLDR